METEVPIILYMSFKCLTKTMENSKLLELVQEGQKTNQKIPPLFFEWKKIEFRYGNQDRIYNQKNKYLFGIK